MRKLLLALAVIVACGLTAVAQTAVDYSTLPRQINCGPWKAGHVQGIAVDKERKFMYFSFTTMLVKTDLAGNVLGSVKGLLGHLGCLELNSDDGRIYGSLEYKNDQIGKGILRREGVAEIEDAFYIAIFDVSKITRMDMDAERDGIMTTVYLPDVLDDYKATVTVAGKEYEHRYGCSGIDGVSFGPQFGKRDGRNFLVVAYGVYGQTERSDNDYQVLLQYDTRDWAKYETPVSQGKMHRNGPSKPLARYYFFTGNTRYGIQNMEYDPSTGYWFMFAYTGKKSQYPNYPMFTVDGSVKARKQTLRGVDYAKGKQLVVAQAEAGLQDASSGVRGWRFKDGATGVCSLGDGYFYISKNSKSEQGQSSTVRLYRFTGIGDKPFEAVK